MGYIRKALEQGHLEHPGSACCPNDMCMIFIRFRHCLCCLLPVFFSTDSCPVLAGAHKSPSSHTDHQQKPVLIRDEKAKWLSGKCRNAQN